MKRSLLSLVAASLLSTAAVAQMPTMDFESWSSQAGPPAYNDPQGWATVNILSNVLLGSNPLTVFRETTNPHGGLYCMRITSVALTNNPAVGQIPDTVGLALTGTITLFPTQGIFPGVPYAGRPAAMETYLRYTPAPVGDSCFMFAALTRWNGTGRDTIAVAGTVVNSAVANWTLYNMPFFYNAAFATAFPDSMVIVCSATDDANPKVGSSMFVDDIAFTGWVGVNENTANTGVSVFPNPASSSTTIRTTNASAQTAVVFDITGREMGRYTFVNGEATLDVATMAAGVYSYTLLNEQQAVVSRGQFSISH